MSETIAKGERLTLKIDDLAMGGAGVGRSNGFVVFVRGGLPGDVVLAQLTKKKKNHGEGFVVEVLEPSPDRVEAPCPYFGQCGGCSWQSLAYPKQAEAKERIVRQSLEHLGGLKDLALRPILAAPEPYRYRNKMDLTFGVGSDGQQALGFHRPNDFKRILDVEACMLQPEVLDRAMGVCRQFAAEHGLPSYDPVTHQGLMRHLMFRHSATTGRFLTIITSATPPPGQAAPDCAALAERLRQACPDMTGFLWGVDNSLADVMRIESVLYSDGDDSIEETLGETRFRVSRQSFFQTNTAAARVLYDVIADCLDLDDTQVVLDAYCGTGSIGIYCARHAGQVWGLELVRDAVWDARSNAALNGLTNCTFLAGDARHTLPLALPRMGARPDCIIVDPPRGGMHKKALAGLLAPQAPVFVYVSCNPTTLARDVTEILAAGYRLTRIQPVDLFPQTYHVETVCRFERTP